MQAYYEAEIVYHDITQESNSPLRVLRCREDGGVEEKWSIIEKKDICGSTRSRKTVSYVIQVRRLQMKHNDSPCNIIAVDETPVWCDMLSETTVDTSGKRTVSFKTTGHEKARVSVVLAAKTDETKLKPMVLFKRAKREDADLNQKFKGRG